jgi:hypothetical protein
MKNRPTIGHCETCQATRDCMASVRAGGPMLRRQCGDEDAMFWSTECEDLPPDEQRQDRGFAEEYAGPQGRLVAVPKWGRSDR